MISGILFFVGVPTWVFGAWHFHFRHYFQARGPKNPYFKA